MARGPKRAPEREFPPVLTVLVGGLIALLLYVVPVLGFIAYKGLDVLGLGAPMIMAARKAGLTPGADLDLSALRSVGSTGAPLPADGLTEISTSVHWLGR